MDRYDINQNNATCTNQTKSRINLVSNVALFSGSKEETNMDKIKLFTDDTVITAKLFLT